MVNAVAKRLLQFGSMHIVVMSSTAARAAPLIEERSGAGKRRSGCRGDVVLGGPCSTAD